MLSSFISQLAVNKWLNLTRYTGVKQKAAIGTLVTGWIARVLSAKADDLLFSTNDTS